MKIYKVWLVILLSFVGCNAKYVNVMRIELNMPKESIFGLPLKSESKYIYPCFEGNVFLDTLENNGVIKIIKEQGMYSFLYYSNNDTINGQFRKLPYEKMDYNISYNIESYMEEELKLFKVIGLIRDGEWQFRSHGVTSTVNYKTKITKQDKDFYCN